MGGPASVSYAPQTIAPHQHTYGHVYVTLSASLMHPVRSQVALRLVVSLYVLQV